MPGNLTDNFQGDKIITDQTPIGWMAYRDGQCHCGECHPLIGRGATEQAAIDELLEWESESE